MPKVLALVPHREVSVQHRLAEKVEKLRAELGNLESTCNNTPQRSTRLQEIKDKKEAAAADTIQHIVERPTLKRAPEV